MAKQLAAVVGIGQTNHTATRGDVSIAGLVREAAMRALEDAQMTWDDIDAVVVGKAPDFFEGVMMPELYLADALGAVGKPLLRVHTAGSVGGSTAIVAASLVQAGIHERVLTVAFEKQSESEAMWALSLPMPFSPPLVAGAGGFFAPHIRAYMHRSGAPPHIGCLVALKDRQNALKNPYAHLHQEWMKGMDVEKVVDLLVNSEQNQMLAYPLRMSDMCPRTDGAAAVVFASEGVASKTTSKPAWVAATANRHDFVFLGDIDWDFNQTMGAAAKKVFAKVGIKEPLKEVDLCELYLPYSYGGLKWMENMGFCGPGEGPRLLWDKVTDMDGELPVNPSGGVMSSNPIGATALLRVGEAAWQIMRRSGPRQVQKNVNYAFATGFGGCSWADVMLLSSKKPA